MTDHDRLSEIFLQACVLPPESIPAFLDQACEGDASLRAELEAMLRQDARLGGTGLLAERVAGAAADVSTASRAPMPERIGPYRILGRLGEGGMGVVYLAEQTEPIRREVALKVIRAGADSEGIVARFEVERQMLASMDHPNIARVFDAGSDAEGRPYFAMERIDGVPITAYCRERRLSVRERLLLFLEVCRGVRHAHRRGVIHRDLKPSNILVTEAGGVRVPKVIDFSIAKALGTSVLGTEFRTRVGQVVGTLEYMSPEQAMGRVDAMDTRSDVYALGVLLYEMIADRLPQDLQGLSLHEAVRKIAEEPPRSLRAESTIAPGRVDSDLETIVSKCLEKEPDRRYGSAAELTEDVERYLDSRPILARRPSRAYQLRKLVGRHRVAFGVAALAITFLVIFSVTVTVQLAVQRRERARADAQARKADRVAQFMAESFQGAPFNLGHGATVVSALDRALEKLPAGESDEPEADAEIRILLGNACDHAGEMETAQRLFRESVVLLQGKLGPRDPQVANALQSLGVCLYYSGKLEEASTAASDVLEIHEAQRPQDPEAIADDLSLLGSIERQRHRLDTAERMFRREIPLREPRYRLIVLHNLAHVLLLEGRIVEARQVLEPALAFEVPPGHAGMVAFDLGIMLCAQGKHREAEAKFREALERERALNEPKSHGAVRILAAHARCLGHLRRFAEGETILREAVTVQAKAGRRLPLDVCATGELASLFLEQHRADEAQPPALEALETDRKDFGDESLPAATDWARLGA